MAHDDDDEARTAVAPVTRTSITHPLEDAEANAPETESDRLAVGTRVGRYIVLGPVGEGGMGAVYAAYDPGLDRKVALKLLLRHELGDAHREFLLGEAKTLAKLRHPNVLGVHDVGATADGRLFMATDLIDGADARAWARAEARTWREVRQVFVEAGRGLAAAHAAGLVHRDFKPRNVLVDRTGHACVADFGIAVDTSGNSENSVAAGTRPYMSPELLRGDNASAASDQYAFGVALHELLFGYRPDEPARTPPAGVARAPGFLRVAIARMLADDPAARFPSMDAVVRAISIDPGRRARLAAAAVIAIAAIVTPIAVATRTSSAPAPCPDTPEVLAGVWDPDRRAAVQAALAQRTSAGAVGETLAALDQYARDWRATHHEACMATRVHRAQTDDVLALRTDCLDRRRGALRAMVDALARAAELGAKEPARAVAGLPSVEVCDDVALLRSRAPLPDSQEQQRAIFEVEVELQALRAASSLVQLAAEVSHADAQKLVDRAKQIGAPHLLATALRLRGFGEGGATAIATFQDAVLTAQAARDYETMIHAGMNLVIFLCNVGRYPEAEFVGGLLRASFDAGGRPASLERSLLAIEGNLGLCQSRPDAAIRAFSRLYELEVTRARPLDLLNASSYAANIAFANQFRERPEEAMEWSSRAEALLVGTSETPNTVLTHFGTAWSALQLGDHAAVDLPLERAATALRVLAGRAGELVCYVPMTKGLLALAKDQRAAARALLDEAGTCFEQAQGTTSTAAALARRGSAELALAEGDAERALRDAKAAAAILALDPADLRNAITHAVVARALVRLGRLDAAAAELALAEPFLAKDDHRDERWAMVAFARAELLLARGYPATAATTAAEARELRAKRKDAFHVAELDALVARARR